MVGQTLLNRVHIYMVVLHCEFFKVLWSENEAVQMSHWYGLSLLCILECFFKLLLSENEAIDASHLNGSSSLWILECFFNCHACLNFAEQNKQQSLSPLWIVEWICNWLALVNFALHLYGCSSLCIVDCLNHVVQRM